MTAGEGWSGFMHNGAPADTPQPDCCTDTGVGGFISVSVLHCCWNTNSPKAGALCFFGSFLRVLCGETIRCGGVASSNGGQLDSHTGVDPAPFTHTHTPEEKLQAGCV